ncbi:hypothetical protein ACFS4T_11780 [Pseudomonas lini]
MNAWSKNERKNTKTSLSSPTPFRQKYDHWQGTLAGDKKPSYRKWLMFKINPTQNRIAPLEIKRFGELGFTERKHLQEWLEKLPTGSGSGRW